MIEVTGTCDGRHYGVRKCRAESMGPRVSQRRGYEVGLITSSP